MTRPAWHTAPDARALAWSAHAAGPGWRPVRAARMRGGIATAVDAVTLDRAGGEQLRLVLRRWLRPGWQDEDAQFTPTREAVVLERLARTLVPAPRVVGVDPDGSACGAPAILMTHLDGRRPSLADETRASRLRAMAEVLALVHSADAGLADVVAPFRPWYPVDERRVPEASRRPGLWRNALALGGREPGPTPTGFIHRDFHPGNTIWRAGRLVGVVDWTTAAWGPTAVDIAHWRANLGQRHGIAVADRVLAACAAIGILPPDQAWWDIRMLLDIVDEPNALAGVALERHEAYLSALLARA